MPNTVTTAHDLAALIDWYEALGVDYALDDDPQDRFEESLRQSRATATSQSQRCRTVSVRCRPSRFRASFWCYVYVKVNW